MIAIAIAWHRRRQAGNPFRPRLEHHYPIVWKHTLHDGRSSGIPEKRGQDLNCGFPIAIRVHPYFSVACIGRLIGGWRKGAQETRRWVGIDHGYTPMNTDKEELDAIKAEGRSQTAGIVMIAIRVHPWLALGGLMRRGHDDFFGDIADFQAPMAAVRGSLPPFRLPPPWMSAPAKRPSSFHRGY